MKRDWTDAHAKVAEEGKCRIPNCQGLPVDPAHIIDRSLVPGADAMHFENIVPLCRSHHERYDAHTLDLLPHLTRSEQATAVYLIGLEAARKRVTGTA